LNPSAPVNRLLRHKTLDEMDIFVFYLFLLFLNVAHPWGSLYKIRTKTTAILLLRTRSQVISRTFNVKVFDDAERRSHVVYSWRRYCGYNNMLRFFLLFIYGPFLLSLHHCARACLHIYIYISYIIFSVFQMIWDKKGVYSIRT